MEVTPPKTNSRPISSISLVALLTFALERLRSNMNRPFPVDAESAIREQATLQSMIDRLSAQSQSTFEALKSRHNALWGVNRLPVEILVMIFHLCGELESSLMSRMRRYLELAWVCHDWKCIIFDQTSFWTRIDMGSKPDFIQLLLERSKSSLLSIQFNQECRGRSTYSLDILLPFLSRCERLELKLFARDFPLILPILKQPAPSLRRLSLVSPSPFLSPLEIPLFSGQAALYSFECAVWDNIPMIFLQPVISGLQALSLTFGISDEYLENNLKSLMTVLASNPALEILILGAFDSVGHSSINLNLLPVVTLHNLQTLFIKTFKLCALLDRITHAPLMSLGVCVRDWPNLDIAAFIAKHFNLTSLRELNIGYSYPIHRRYIQGFHALCIWGSDQEDLARHHDSGNLCPSSVSLTDTFQSHVQIHLVAEMVADYKTIQQLICFIVSSSNLSTLVFDEPEDITQGRIANGWLESQVEIITQAATVRHLVLRGGHDIIDTVEELTDALLCPRLESLTCIKVKYSKAPRRVLWKPLIECAKVRQRTLKRVNLHACPLLPFNRVKQLEQLGVQVVAE